MIATQLVPMAYGFILGIILMAIIFGVTLVLLKRKAPDSPRETEPIKKKTKPEPEIFIAFKKGDEIFTGHLYSPSLFISFEDEGHFEKAYQSMNEGGFPPIGICSDPERNAKYIDGARVAAAYVGGDPENVKLKEHTIKRCLCFRE